MINEFSFDWGEPFCIREALKHYYKASLTKPDIDSLGYCLDDGKEKLLQYTKEFIKRTTGKEYKYVLITNGACGAINVVLRALAEKENRHKCFTHKYHFPFYSKIIEKNGYEHEIGLYNSHEIDLSGAKTVGLVDSPSNPSGDIVLYTDSYNNIIWDSVYHNDVYINTIPVKPDHRVNCGSYSKVFGVPGVRIGWIATDSLEDYVAFRDENLHESCSISVPSQDLVIDMFEKIDMDNFLRSSKYRVNNNREMFDRASYLFDKQPVPENGMFYAAWTTPYVVRLLDKLMIRSIELDREGNDRLLRFNLAQTNEITRKAIRFLISEDGK